MPGLAAIGVLLFPKRRVPKPELFEQKDDGASLAAEQIESGTTNPTVKQAGDQAQPLKLPLLFWVYTGFFAGVGTFGVMSYRMVATGLIATPAIPVIYAIAMTVDGVFALLTGALYDKIGTKRCSRRPSRRRSSRFRLYRQRRIRRVRRHFAGREPRHSGIHHARRRDRHGARLQARHIIRPILGIHRNWRARRHKPTGMLYAYGQSAIVSYTMALETAALIAPAITLYLAKR